MAFPGGFAGMPGQQQQAGMSEMDMKMVKYGSTPFTGENDG